MLVFFSYYKINANQQKNKIPCSFKILICNASQHNHVVQQKPHKQKMYFQKTMHPNHKRTQMVFIIFPHYT
jgi:hypothetical protein